MNLEESAKVNLELANGGRCYFTDAKRLKSYLKDGAVIAGAKDCGGREGKVFFDNGPVQSTYVKLNDSMWKLLQANNIDI